MVKIGKYIGLGAFLFAVVALAAYYGPRILKRYDPTVAAGPYERRVADILEVDTRVRRAQLLKKLEPFEAELKKGNPLTPDGQKAVVQTSRDIADLDKQSVERRIQSFTPASVAVTLLEPPRCSLQARENCSSCNGATTIHVQEQQVSEMKFPVVADKDCWSGWMKLPQGYVKGGIDIVYTGNVWIQEYGRTPVPAGPAGYNLFGGRVFRVMARTEDINQEPVKSTTTFVLPGKSSRQAKK